MLSKIIECQVNIVKQHIYKFKAKNKENID